MNKEKAVKAQARQALKGNLLVILSGLLLITLIIFTFSNAQSLLMLMTGIYDFEKETVHAGSEWTYTLITFGLSLCASLLLPFCNGALKTAANTVTAGKAEIKDILYYFRDPKTYLRTMVFDLGLLMHYFLITSVLEVPLRIAQIPHEIFSGDETTVLSVCIGVAVLLWKLLTVMLFLHYPLTVYALDDSRGIPYYLWGSLGFSFRHFGSLLALFFSFFGWLLLCFFVVPALYVFPYYITAAVNSTKWLLSLETPNIPVRSAL